MTTPIDTLTRSEHKAIIGTPIRDRQLEWLTQHGWPHEVNANGYPVVLRSVALEKLGGEVLEQTWRGTEKFINELEALIERLTSNIPDTTALKGQ